MQTTFRVKCASSLARAARGNSSVRSPVVAGTAIAIGGSELLIEMFSDSGEPTELTCRETAAGSGVFVRGWSKASVQMDCNAFEATISSKRSEV